LAEIAFRRKTLSGETVESYERDTRQFLQFMTGHCGGRPALRIFARCDRRICAASGCAAQRRSGAAHAGAALLRHPVTAALPRKARSGECGRRDGVARPETTEIAAEAFDGRRRAVVQDEQLAEEPWIAAQRRGPDAPLGSPAHFRALGERRDLQPGEAILRVVGKGSKTRLAPVLPLASQAVAEYRKLCPYHLGADAPLFRGARVGRSVRPLCNARW
jgi:integrase/recombinase XerC